MVLQKLTLNNRENLPNSKLLKREMSPEGLEDYYLWIWMKGPAPFTTSFVVTASHFSIRKSVSPDGFEPSTPALKGQCSTRLSYGLGKESNE